MDKIIKGSKRGLTFTFKHQKMKIGTKYNYVAIPKSNKIYIIPSNSSKGLKISKKKGCNKVYSLIDIRNKQVKKITEKADKLGLTINNNSITVTAFKDDRELFSYNVKKDVNLDLKGNIIRVVSMFSGAGMLDYAFHKDQDFKIVFASDIMKEACESYRENIGNHIVNKSITEINSNEIPVADVILGGVPCKPFSNANRKANNRLDKHEDSKLVLEFIRLVREGLYKVFAIENVPSLISACNGQYFQAIKECLDDYEIDAKILQDGECGGYSIRKRVFIVGSKIGKANFEILKKFIPKTVKRALDKVNEEWFNFRDITIPKSETIEKIKNIKQGENFMAIPKAIRGKGNHSNRCRRLEEDKPSCTITNFRKAMILHPTENRIISVAEALAISGFDNDFKVLGSLASRQQQVGNGVPFNLGLALKNVIKNIFARYYSCI
ncbi:DNA cytosine methyltransferase [Clostridium perfringens]|uniref:DNA cytosine methyltransferase n=1 Tax=Clostridium perfringens TaxID=1502 RepID=UPI003F42DB4F